MSTTSYSPEFSAFPTRNGSRLFWIDSRGGPRRTLWTAKPDGSGARMLLGGNDAVTSFRAFDGGRRIVVASDCGGDEHHQLRLIDVQGDEPVRHLTSDFFVQHNLGAIAPGGKRLAYAANALQRERFEIFVVDLETGLRQDHVVSAFPGEWKVEAWARDGTEIYISQQRSAGDVSLFALNATTGALRSLCPLAPGRFLELRPVEGGILLRTDWGNDFLYVALLAPDGSLTAKARVAGHDIDGYLPLDGATRFAISVNVELGHELRFGAMAAGWTVADLPLTARASLSNPRKNGSRA